MKMYHGPSPLPSAQEIARALGGHVRADGCIAFPGPGRKHADRSCTLRIDADGPHGFVVADARREIHWQHLKDHVRCLLGLPAVSRGAGNFSGGRGDGAR